MSNPVAENQESQKPNDKELNFRKQEQMYQRMLEEKEARIKALEQATQQKQYVEEDVDDEPYVDYKKLEKKLAQFGQQTKQETQSDIQTAVQKAIQEERKQNWLKQNSDFYDIMQHADKLEEKDPELAEAILEMPDGFERQKLVYKNIKALGLHQPPQKQNSIQDVVNDKRRSPYYQPSGVAPPPYNQTGDFSPSGQKNAYEKMKSLIGGLRLGG